MKYHRLKLFLLFRNERLVLSSCSTINHSLLLPNALQKHKATIKNIIKLTNKTVAFIRINRPSVCTMLYYLDERISSYLASCTSCKKKNLLYSLSNNL